MKQTKYFYFAIAFCVLLSIVYIIYGGDKHKEINELSTNELIEIVNNEDDYYLDAIEELGMRPNDSEVSAPVLAKAFLRKRRDSYIPGIALARFGPLARAVIPEIKSGLLVDYSVTRAYAAYALGSMGEAAKCVVPDIANLLWDKDGEVRSAAAWALGNITKSDLIDWNFQVDTSGDPGFAIDKPEGSITSKARVWWKTIGIKETWPEKCVED